jgi:hypothetical protein
MWLALGTWLLGSLAAAAMPLEVQTFPSGRFVTGGVGTEERAQMEQLRPQFNLRILTARKRSGEFLADARVRVIRGAETLFQAVMTGPLMLVQLPAGSYRVVVAVEGKEIERSVNIRPGERRELYLYWD